MTLRPRFDGRVLSAWRFDFILPAMAEEGRHLTQHCLLRLVSNLGCGGLGRRVAWRGPWPLEPRVSQVCGDEVEGANAPEKPGGVGEGLIRVSAGHER